ncbi:3'(2'),5'-bisphosphate nucleotidase [Parashewanella spongiae]|uniref:3'(2'),5'-bisphosphate nucleotidase CysQ n=1 Tax=Parashewanella spongiae TaxID=342950 RepID=A0A3A6UA35_9GAMM|nr:3'(2'),5'-bisphosphate nucleotidase CysQ [Parashewanella spongiae]MCL1077160.1 3'(2'),5'-bisphosphate nucleotidase CysQ [Parashewanella spongiae]RJY18817.1 3'(2'),5'-bisphosphate nucleotidase [Parashewanella spongiae]
MAAVNRPEQLIESVIAIATEAGQKIKAIFHQGDFEQTIKLDSTPVTSADLAAHQVICERLMSLTPDIPVLSEEDAEIPLSIRESWQRYWLVDPLDGTGEFIAGSNDFSVLIALVDNHQPVLGVVYVPMTQECYFASLGNGAYKRSQGEDFPIHCRSGYEQNESALKLAVSRRQDPNTVLNMFNKKQDYELVRLGGAALKSCLVAEGQADCYIRIGPTGEWDTAAAQVIIKEAGGQVMTTDLQPLTYNRRETLENPNFIVVGQSTRNWKDLLKAAS